MGMMGMGSAAPRIGKVAPGSKRKATGLLASEGKKKSSGHWIANATKNKGGLHKSLGIAQSKTIPTSTLNAAAKKGGKVGAEARLAKTLKGFKR